MEGGRCRGRQRKGWMGNVKAWTSYPRRNCPQWPPAQKNWTRISAESSLMPTPFPLPTPTTQSVKGLKWTEGSKTIEVSFCFYLCPCPFRYSNSPLDQSITDHLRVRVRVRVLAPREWDITGLLCNWQGYKGSSTQRDRNRLRLAHNETSALGVGPDASKEPIKTAGLRRLYQSKVRSVLLPATLYTLHFTDSRARR